MFINKLVEISIIDITAEDLYFTERTRDWCKLPYDGHKKGCPNHCNSDTCPPNVEYKPKLPDKLKILVCKFDMKKYVNSMSMLHPDWTEKQLRCVLWWQGSIKKIMKDKISEDKLNPTIIYGSGSGFGGPSMEAIGINVILTLKKLHIPIKAKPTDTVYMAALLCWNDIWET